MSLLRQPGAHDGVCVSWRSLNDLKHDLNDLKCTTALVQLLTQSIGTLPISIT